MICLCFCWLLYNGPEISKILEALPTSLYVLRELVANVISSVPKCKIQMSAKIRNRFVFLPFGTCFGTLQKTGVMHIRAQLLHGLVQNASAILHSIYV